MTSLRVGTPKLEHYIDGAVIGHAQPRVSWEVISAPRHWRQTAYELLLRTKAGDQVAHQEGSQQVLVSWPFRKVESRQFGQLQVRVRGGDGEWSGWSQVREFEATLLDPDEFGALMISPSESGGLNAPAPIFSKEFCLDTVPTQARIYLSAFGIYEAAINGQKIGDELLAPGWTSYANRLNFQTHDVTNLLIEGLNRIDITVGNGWWRGNLGRPPTRGLYGERLGVIAQLEYMVAGKRYKIMSDASWEARESCILRDDLYNGQTTDFTVASGLAADVDVLEFKKDSLVPQHSPPVRAVEELSPQSITVQPNGDLLVDFGVNIVGWVRAKLKDLPSGSRIEIRHAEVLENGSLATRPLRTAQATDVYVTKDSETVLEPSFTFHGFRFVEMNGVTFDQVQDLTAVVISSDLPRTGWFRCSSPSLNALHDNVVRSARGNFVSIPTDCPQRDERLGWTGDIQVFSPTATILFDASAFLGSWLRDLALEQKADGSIPYVVPDIHGRAEPAAAGWGDAATIVPWVLYRRYGDAQILQDQYSSMKGWVRKIASLSGTRMIWDQGFQYGDWLDPTAPPDDPAAVLTPTELVATAYAVRSTDVMAQTAVVLGRTADAEEFGALAREMREAFSVEFVSPAGRLASETQTAYALALNFALMPTVQQRDFAAKELQDLVRRSGFTIATGFLGTPLILDALAEYGGAHEAFRLLLQTEMPSWLYPVEQGATTIWERWDSMLENGDINPGQMTSFNHYAFGAVADWMHREIGGMTFLEPAGRRIRIAPRLGGGISEATTKCKTPYGMVNVGWQQNGTKFSLTANLPVGVEAEVEMPGQTVSFDVSHGDYVWETEILEKTSDFPDAPRNREPTVREAMDDPDVWAEVCEIAREDAAKSSGKDVAEAMWPYFDRPLTAAARIAGHSTIRPGELSMGHKLRALVERRSTEGSVHSHPR